MDMIVLVIMLAILVEAIVEYVKTAFKRAGFKVPGWLVLLVALVCAIALALLTGADIFAWLGISFRAPIIGCILTGIFLSRGSNYVNDLIGRLRKGGNGSTLDGLILEDVADSSAA